MTQADDSDCKLMTYRINEQEPGSWQVLPLLEGAIRRITQADEAAQAGRIAERLRLLLEAQCLVYALAAGCSPPKDELTGNLLRLYEYMLHGLGAADPEGLQSVRQVMQTLLEGITALRARVLRAQTPREGCLPPSVDMQG